mgnify:CR=1 FL=1
MIIVFFLYLLLLAVFAAELSEFFLLVLARLKHLNVRWKTIESVQSAWKAIKDAKLQPDVFKIYIISKHPASLSDFQNSFWGTCTLFGRNLEKIGKPRQLNRVYHYRVLRRTKRSSLASLFVDQSQIFVFFESMLYFWSALNILKPLSKLRTIELGGDGLVPKTRNRLTLLVVTRVWFIQRAIVTQNSNISIWRGDSSVKARLINWCSN